MVDIDEFAIEKYCEYKDEKYRVRDNGAVYRFPLEGKSPRKLDGSWTFGKKNEKGYLLIGNHRVHIIIATAFYGAQNSKEYVVDHIDTNRCNNRPENLRWVTRLENLILNPVTAKRIATICGSIENFLMNPSKYYSLLAENPNYEWMRTVTKEEAQSSLMRLQAWAKSDRQSKGGAIGDWIFERNQFNTNPAKPPLPNLTPLVSTAEMRWGYSTGPLDDFFTCKTIDLEYDKVVTLPSASGFHSPHADIRQSAPEQKIVPYESKMPNAKQVNWKTPAEFPFCPTDSPANSLCEYFENMSINGVFSKTKYGDGLIVDKAWTTDGKIVVKNFLGDDAVKKWALTIISIMDGYYYHEAYSTYFDESGADKNFTLLQGKEWNGGDVFDDFG